MSAPHAPRTIALIVAAGSGSRMGQDLPKQYLTLGGKAVLRHCLETFLAHPGIAGVRVVINPAFRDEFTEASLMVLVAYVRGLSGSQGSRSKSTGGTPPP